MRASIHRSMRCQSGSSLLLTILIVAALAILATSIAVVSIGDRTDSRYDRHAMQALAAAETGVAFAKSLIISQTAPLEDFDSDGRPDFAIADTLDWGGRYTVLAEASDVVEEDVTAFLSNGFTIVSEGNYLGAVRRVKVEIAHDTYFKFARFVYQHSIQFECGDVMAGEVYTGGTLSLSCGCPVGEEPLFLEKAYAVQRVPQADCGIFEEGYEEGVQVIDLPGSLDWEQIRDKAHGIGSDNACEGRGSVGIYISLPLTDPLDLASQAGWDLNTVVLHYFDFCNTTLAPPDTVITYRSIPVMNTVTGEIMRRDDFNGIVLFEGDARVRGTLDGTSAWRLSVFGTDHGLIRGDIVAGHFGYDPITRLPNNSGDPVTTAVIAENYVAMDDGTPRILRIDAALFSRTSNWRCLGGMGNHPIGGPGPLDLDIDGIVGETPYNNDPDPGIGWDELNITDKHWILNLTGPIITYAQGDAYPWNAEPIQGAASGPTHRYNYDLDYMRFPPACFPLPVNLWIDISWTEIFEARSALAEHLPN